MRISALVQIQRSLRPKKPLNVDAVRGDVLTQSLVMKLFPLSNHRAEQRSPNATTQIPQNVE
jgi:hypothetical protein